MSAYMISQTFILFYFKFCIIHPIAWLINTGSVLSYQNLVFSLFFFIILSILSLKSSSFSLITCPSLYSLILNSAKPSDFLIPRLNIQAYTFMCLNISTYLSIIYHLSFFYLSSINEHLLH